MNRTAAAQHKEEGLLRLYLRCDAPVVRGEVVAGIAEGACPDLRGEVCPDVGVQDRAALLAWHRCIGYYLH